MTDEELVEKAAQTLWEAGSYPEERVPWNELGDVLAKLGEPDAREEYRKLARAVVNMVLEEAEKKAKDSYPFDIEVWMNSTKKEMTALTGNAIAAAIRALKSEQPK